MSDLSITLAEWSATVVGQPVVLGTCDCGTLVREVLAAQGIPTEVAWDSPLSAGRALLQHGRGFAPWLAALGLEEIPPLFARTGDILVLTETHAAPVIGPHALVAEHDGIVTPMPMADVVWAAAAPSAWRVVAHG